MANPGISITPATASNLACIQNCSDAAYTRYIERIGCKPAPMLSDYACKIKHGQIRVAYSNGSFAGFVVFYHREDDDYMYLDNVAVLPECTGLGIGKALIEFVEQSARDLNLNAVELYTNEVMSENLAIYPKLGYQEIGRKEQDGYHRVFFRKTV